jgi:hypothetical protein
LYYKELAIFSEETPETQPEFPGVPIRLPDKKNLSFKIEVLKQPQI